MFRAPAARRGGYLFTAVFVTSLLATVACGQTTDTTESDRGHPFRSDLQYLGQTFDEAMGPVRAELLDLGNLENSGLSVVDRIVTEGTGGNPVYSIKGIPIEEGFLVRSPYCQPGSRAFVYTAFGELPPPSRPTATPSDPGRATPTPTPTPPPDLMIEPIPTRLTEEGLLEAGWPTLPLEHIQPDYRGISYMLTGEGYINDDGSDTSIPTVSVEEIEVISITYDVTIDLKPPLEELVNSDTVTDKTRILRFKDRPEEEVIIIDQCPEDLRGEQFVYYENSAAPSDDPTPVAQLPSDECGETVDTRFAVARWAYHFTSLQVMDQGVDAVALAKVLGCAPGKVVREDTDSPTYFTNVHLEIIEDWSRKPLDYNELTVSLPGGKTTPFFKGMPPYVVGQEYLLFLKKSSENIDPSMYFVPNPMSRYHIAEDKLQANLTYAPIKELDGRTVQSVKEELLDSRLIADTFLGVQPHASWERVNVPGWRSQPSFSIQLPEGWKFHESQGIDSYVGEFVGTDMALSLDYGGLSGGANPRNYPQDRYQVGYEYIDGEEAILILSKGETTGEQLVMSIPGLQGGTNVNVYGSGLTPEQVKTAVAIFRSIKGMAGLLELNVTFGFHDGPIVEPFSPIPNVVVEVVSPGGKTQIGERQLAADRLGNGGWELHRDGRYLFWLDPGTYDIDIHFLEDVTIFGMPRRFEIGTDEVIEEEIRVYLTE